MIKGDKQEEEGVCLCLSVCVCLCVCTTCGHLYSGAWAQGISPPYYLCYSPALAPGLSVAPLSRHSQLCWSCIRINQHPNNMANAINWVRHCATIKWGFFLLNQWTVPVTCDSGLKCTHWLKRHMNPCYTVVSFVPKWDNYLKRTKSLLTDFVFCM